MLDIKYIRENVDQINEVLVNKPKGGGVDLDYLLKLDDHKKELTAQINDLRAKRNELDNQIKFEKDQEKKKSLIEENTKLKPKLVELEEKLKEVEPQWLANLYKVPNIYHPDTPIGKDDSENAVIKTVGEPKKFDFTPKDHMELGLAHNIIDTEISSRVSGSRFNYLFGEAVLLQFAIIQHVFHTLTDPEIIEKLAKQVNNPFYKTFLPVVPPVIARSDVMKKMDRFDPIEDRYYYEPDDVLFIGSAEHTLGPIHMNQILEEKDLPIRYIGYSTAFRREAGTYGKDVNGIFRRHQFDKLEMETFVPKEYGLVEQDFIIAVQEYLVQSLELPYQLVLICTGDMGKPDYKQVDVECFLPGQNKYRETHTSDYMTDYQSRRLNIKYKTKTGDKEYVHMNDATAFAIGRILIAIIENYQQKDGSIVVPKVLQQYTKFDVIK